MREAVKAAPSAPRTTLLFVSESVTLAQVVRLLVLARALDPRRYDVHFAHSWPDERIFEGSHFTLWRIEGAEPGVTLKAAEEGQLPSLKLLRRQVAADLDLFARVRPSLVIGDLRLSLTTSAPLAGIRTCSLINAYWSARRLHRALPLPDHPMVRLFGVETAQRYFDRAAPTVMALAARPINVLRKEHGLSEIGDLHEVFAFGDVTLFPDVPELTPLAGRSDRSVFLGPLLWSPRMKEPNWWRLVGERGRPIVYVTLGSSGELSVLPVVLRALEKMPVEVIVSTAGRIDPAALGPRVHAAEMLPGDEAARRASVVITNGGSSTGYQALYEGTPVVGLPSNLDQYLAMTAIERYGAGALVRSGTATVEAVHEAVSKVMTERSYQHTALRAKQALRAIDPDAVFAGVLERFGTRAEPLRC